MEETFLPDTDNQENQHSTNSVVKWIPKRYVVTFLTFLGNIVLYLLRTNLSIAIIEMTSDKLITIGNESYVQNAEFHWSAIETGLILSSFSWGYSLSFVGGFCANKFGAVNIFGYGLAGTGVLTLLSPFLINCHSVVYIGARIIEGALEGFTVACISEIFMYWAPSDEKTRLLALAHSGGCVGAAINHPLAGFIAAVLGWEAIFYVTGAISLIWFLVWLKFVANTPNEDRFISSEEKSYLNENTNFVRKTEIFSYPWNEILKSKSVWAFLNERFVSGWSTSFIVYYLPLYIKDVKDVNTASIGLMASIPIICSFFGLTGASFVADYIRSRKIMSIQKIHKVFVCLAQGISAALLIIAGLSGNFVTSMICFCLIRFWYCLAFSSYDVIPLDMFPRYASLITGMSFTSMNFGYLLNPLLMTSMVSNHTSSEWYRYIMVLSIFNIWGGVIFLVYGSGELQPWAEPRIRNEDKNEPGTEMRPMTRTC